MGRDCPAVELSLDIVQEIEEFWILRGQCIQRDKSRVFGLLGCTS